MSVEILVQPPADRVLDGTGFGPDDRAPLAFHRTLPGFRPTPLVDLPELATRLGVRTVLMKDEAMRAGLPSFKILGASWASVRAVAAAWLDGAPVLEVDALRAALDALRAERPGWNGTLVAATDGNHGRGVARIARLLGLQAHILVPLGMAEARMSAIADEGATVSVVDGTYDDAIAASAALAAPDRLVVSDTSWDGYADTPRDVVDGYSTLFFEIDDQREAAGLPAPTHVVLQAGVGSFAAAGLRHAAGSGARTVVVEPETANSLMVSAGAGRITEVPGPHPSSMAGLNCGLPSLLAWPVVQRMTDVFLAIGDDALVPAVAALDAAGVASGESGAAGVAALLAAVDAGLAGDLALTPDSVVLVVNTEGITDPVNHAALLAAAR